MKKNKILLVSILVVIVLVAYVISYAKNESIPSNAPVDLPEKSEKTKLQKDFTLQEEDLMGQAPEKPAIPIKHVVKQGETLSEIAQKYNLSIKFLMANNLIKYPDKIKAGQELMLQPKKDMLIKVSLKDQKVKVYENGKLIKNMVCSSGVEGYETPRGIFYIQNRGKWFYSQKYKMGAKYWTSFKDWGVYLFHSIPLNENKQIIKKEAEKLGRPASHGCLRLSIKDSKWVYENVPSGTKVIIGE